MIRAGWATVSIFIGLILAALLPIATVYLDIVVLENGLPEVGVTETMQAVLLLASAVLFARKVRRNPKARGFLVLVTGFFLVMFIRELDYYLDMIVHGFWVCPALLVTGIAIAYAVKNGGTTQAPMTAFGYSQQGAIICIGLVIVLVFSRLFGTGSFWELILQDQYVSLSKTIVQEGLELLGYGIILFGSAYRRQTPRNLAALEF